MGEILVAYDGSEYAEKALNHARNLLKEGDELIVLYVIPTALITEFADIKPDVPVSKAHNVINNVVSRLKKEGISKVMGIVREGDVADEILSIASKLRCDLIVLGAKSFSKIGRFTLGSVADKVARHANRPVLIVR